MLFLGELIWIFDFFVLGEICGVYFICLGFFFVLFWLLCLLLLLFLLLSFLSDLLCCSRLKWLWYRSLSSYWSIIRGMLFLLICGLFGVFFVFRSCLILVCFKNVIGIVVCVLLLFCWMILISLRIRFVCFLLSVFFNLFCICKLKMISMILLKFWLMIGLVCCWFFFLLVVMVKLCFCKWDVCFM